MKKTMKKRAFISAIAMLIVSAIVLTSSTFAWFSMAKQVEVETMQLNITSPEGIQISANTSAFTTSLTMADFDGTSATRFVADPGNNSNHFPDVLSPSSSSFQVTARNLPKFYSGSINDQNKITITPVTDETGGYVVFDLFVKLGSDAAVYWGESTITCADNPDVPTAMRIAMVNCGASTDKTAVMTILSGIQANGNNNTIVAYEVDAKNHTEASGAADGTAVETRPMNQNGNNLTPVSGTTILSLGTSAVNCPHFTNDQQDSVYFNGKQGINRIRVYIWMEGQDIDCANDVAGSQIEVNLKLHIN